MAITQVIQQFPAAPSSTQDTPVEFNAKADSFVHHQADTYVTEVNTWATQANGLKGEMNQIKTDIDGIAAVIPTGTIDDTTIGADKVYSNQKTEATYNKIISQDDTGIVLGGAALTAVGIIGTNPKATLWRDGSITGSSNHGYFTKYPNGNLQCRATITKSHPNGASNGGVYVSDSVESLFPIVAVGSYQVSCGFRDASSGFWIGVGGTNVLWSTHAYRNETFSRGDVGDIQLTLDSRWKA